MADLAAQGQNVELNTIECPGSMHLYHQDDYIADKLQKTNWAWSNRSGKGQINGERRVGVGDNMH